MGIVLAADERGPVTQHTRDGPHSLIEHPPVSCLKRHALPSFNILESRMCLSLLTGSRHTPGTSHTIRVCDFGDSAQGLRAEIFAFQTVIAPH